jgi:outer membrane protein OmpA-like peptidoglycan-associated protein
MQRKEKFIEPLDTFSAENRHNPPESRRIGNNLACLIFEHAKGPIDRTVACMKRRFWILAGAAIGFLLASSPLGALTLLHAFASEPTGAPLRNAQLQAASVILAQADQEELLRKLRRKGGERGKGGERAAPRQEAPAAAAEPAPRGQRERVERSPEIRAPATAEKRVLRGKAREAAEQPPERRAPAAEQRLQRREQRKAIVKRAERKAPVTVEEPRPRRKARDIAKQRTAEPKPPTTAQERLKRQEERKAAMRAAEPKTPKTAGEKPALEENAARIFDSAKEKQRRGPKQATQPVQAKAVPLPESDASAQVQIRARPEQVQSVISEEGRRIKRPRKGRPEIPAGADLVREVNNRFIFQTNNNYFIERPREERVIVDAREVYYEELPRSRQREVVVRPDGTRIITIRNRYGDVIRRVKVLPDDREIVLVYVDDDYYDEVLEWRDPGIDLPPLSLTIPVSDYILDAGLVEDPEVYYTFLDQPPVERVERTYSLAEVRRSARLRDKVRRIDLDIINFEFGSADIPESEIQKLEGVAEAMQRLLTDSPGETFLIEGHTDAVGAEVANLALSDQRAEAVATALTNVFDIPPENMETQGYGEQYLKVETSEPERENRRVAIRRITPLVAPVASSE